jgi:ABC-type glycerol-3-phosphate transport system substrate-binding protein
MRFWKAKGQSARLVAAVAALLLCLLLSSCLGKGKQGATEDQTEQTMTMDGQSKITEMILAKEYDVKTFTLANSLGVVTRFANGAIYGWGDNLQLFEIDRISAEDGSSECFFNLFNELEGAGDSEQAFLYCFDLTKTGGVGLVSVRTEDATTFYLTEFDENGNFKKNTEIENGAEFLSVSPSTQVDMAVDGEGNVVVLSKDMVLISAKGKKIAQIPIAQNGEYKTPVRTASGDVWLWHRMASGLGVQRVDFSKGSLEDVENLPKELRGLGSIIDDDGECDALVFDEFKIMEYDKVQNAWIATVEFAQYGIKGLQVIRAGKTGDKYVILTRDRETIVLSPRAEDAPKKETVILATTKRYERLDNLAAEYNKSQDRYVLKIVEYAADAASSLEYQDPVNRMMVDMLGEDSPDLFDLRDFFLMSGLTPHWQDMLEKDYIEDLMPYLEKSAKLGREQYEEKALAMCMHQGRLAALPTGYMLTTLLVDREAFGEYGWSVKEMIAYDKAHPKTELIKDANSSKALYLCLYYNIADFVDFEKKETHLDSPEFQEILEYAASYPPGEQWIQYTAEERLVNMQLLYGIVNIQQFQNTKYEGHAQIVGFPSMDGKSVTGMDMDIDGCAFAICTRSKKKEAAWDFIEFTQGYLQGGDMDRYLGGFGGFPARKDTMNAILSELSDEDGPLSVEKGKKAASYGSSYAYYPFSAEEKALWEKMLETSVTQTPDTRMVWSIIEEETRPYFQGQKGLSQTIDAIESRVRLYLLEK